MKKETKNVEALLERFKKVIASNPELDALGGQGKN